MNQVAISTLGRLSAMLQNMTIHVRPTPFMLRIVIAVILIGLAVGGFWTFGVQRSKDTLLSNVILPVGLLQPTVNSGCMGGVTIMNVVAHQDDDLLFMNPNLLHHIAAGHCVRTVYVTAGDAGQNSQYWLRRERGSQAAYASLLGDKKEVWNQRTIKLADHEIVTVVNPRGNKRVSLIFMRLADGNIDGKGFAATNHESIAKLLSNELPVIHTVDGQSNYTSDQLTKALLLFMKTYQPTEINTQVTSDEGHAFHDHSDHMTVGQYTQRAHSEYTKQAISIPIHYYVGYPIREKQASVSGDDFHRKTEAFIAYAQFDGDACHIMAICTRMPTFWSYLHRQYTAQQWVESSTSRQ